MKMNHQNIIDSANRCLQIKHKINEYYALVGGRNKDLNAEAQAVIYSRIDDLANDLANEEMKLKKLTA